MKVVTTVSFGIRSEMIENVLSTAANLGLTTKRIAVFGGRYHFVAKGEDAEPAIDEFCTYLNNHQIRWNVLRLGAYSEEELQSAPLLVLRVNRAARIEGGPKRGVRYDFSSACSVCGTGARQISPLILGARRVLEKGQLIPTDHDEYLVNSEIASGLRKANLSGLRLLEAESPEGKGLGWFQILPLEHMPPMAASTKGIERSRSRPPCPVCGRDGHYHRPDEPLQVAYSREILEGDLPDVTCTYECFGKSGLREPLSRSRFAKPMLLVKPRVREIFKVYKVRGLWFDPVVMAEEKDPGS